MTYRELLTGACQQGMEAHEALTLLEHLFSLSRTSLLIHMDEDCDEQKISSFEQMAARRLAGYPLQYLLGEWEFFGLPFYVGEGVLIPRADTEVLVETALELCDGLFSPVICDLCSGTGCIPIALSKNLPSQASLTAVELSEQALSYLYRNKERHRCDNRTGSSTSSPPTPPTSPGRRWNRCSRRFGASRRWRCWPRRRGLPSTASCPTAAAPF